MGNTIAASGGSGRRKKTKVMKLSGESFKLKTPISAMDVVKDYPGHALLESKSVKQFGIRAKPLELKEELKPNKLYFLVELPKIMQRPSSCGVRSSTSAEDRLECLMISRRSSAPELMRSMKQQSSLGDSQQQVKVKLLRSQLEKITAESKDGAELAHKVLDLCSQTTKFSCKN